MTDPKVESNKSFADSVPTWAIVALFVFAVVAVGLGYALKGPDQGDANGAKESCRRVVETRLKSPGSAEYPSSSAVQSGSRWTVSGQVDSENSFGASVRNDYRCELAYQNDDWALVSVSVSAN